MPGTGTFLSYRYRNLDSQRMGLSQNNAHTLDSTSHKYLNINGTQRHHIGSPQLLIKAY